MFQTVDDLSPWTSFVAFARLLQWFASLSMKRYFSKAFVLAFFGAFRISELVPANKQGTSGIRFEQVVVDQFGVHIWLQQSKMDQCGKGRWVNLCVQEDGIVFPLRGS